MTREEFNSRALNSKIGSQVPLQSSQYKHSYEYDMRSWYREGDSDDGGDSLHLRVARGVMFGAPLAILIWLSLGGLIWIVRYSFG